MYMYVLKRFCSYVQSVVHHPQVLTVHGYAGGKTRPSGDRVWTRLIGQ